MDIYNFKVKQMDGTEKALSDYQGQVLLIVNTASQCGFTPQFAELEKLYQEYRYRGFFVLGFPCDQFHGQEPLQEPEIVTFCQTNYGVTFPLFAKVQVNGSDAVPLYKYLAEQRKFKGFNMEHPLGHKLAEILSQDAPDYQTTFGIKWNFTKFLIDKKGHVAERYEPTADISEISHHIEKML